MSRKDVPPTLRVALDTRMIDHSGIGTYIRGLMGALPRLDPPVQLLPVGAAQGLTAPIYGIREQLAVPRAVEAFDEHNHLKNKEAQENFKALIQKLARAAHVLHG